MRKLELDQGHGIRRFRTAFLAHQAGGEDENPVVARMDWDLDHGRFHGSGSFASFRGKHVATATIG